MRRDQKRQDMATGRRHAPRRFSGTVGFSIWMAMVAVWALGSEVALGTAEAGLTAAAPIATASQGSVDLVGPAGIEATARALAVDEDRELVWTYDGGVLRAEGLDGTLLLERPLRLTGTAHLVVSPVRPTVWIAGGDRVVEIDLGGAVRHGLRLDEAAIALAAEPGAAWLWVVTSTETAAVDAMSGQKVVDLADFPEAAAGAVLELEMEAARAARRLLGSPEGPEARRAAGLGFEPAHRRGFGPIDLRVAGPRTPAPAGEAAGLEGSAAASSTCAPRIADGLFPVSGLASEPGFSSEPGASVVFDDGGGPALYVAGSFQYAGGRRVDHVARWDGVQWQPVGVGFNADVETLAVFDDGTGPALYAAGRFSKTGGLQVNGVARWDGASWSRVGLGFDDWVFALTVHDDGNGPALYAAGTFFFADFGTGWHGESLAVSANGLARWDGARWSSLGVTPPAVPYALTSFPDGTQPRLYVGHASGISIWDGATLTTSYDTGFFSAAKSFAAVDHGAGSQLYAALDFELLRLDGSSWSSLGTLTGLLHELAGWDDGAGQDLYVGGDFADAGGVGSPHLAGWDGAGWFGVGGGRAETVSGLGVFGVGGGAPRLIALQTSGAAAWSGSAWTEESAEGPNGLVQALVAHDDGRGEALFAAGTFTAIDGQPFSRIARWDGSGWSEVGGGFDGAVRALAVWNGGLYAAGDFTSAGGGAASRIARWDGVSWSPLGSGFSGTAWALAVFDDGSGDALYAAGDFGFAGVTEANRIARWDGSTWSALGSGLGSRAYALTVWDDGGGAGLYAGGDFTVAGGVPANRAARWRNGSWSALGSGANDTVRALAVFDDGTGPALVAGGKFTQAGGLTARRVARWSGSSWSAVGSGLGPSSITTSEQVFALAELDDGLGRALYAGGSFKTSGSAVVKRFGLSDGGGWSGVGDGASDSVFAFTVWGGGPRPGLYLGGGFVNAGGVPSGRLAAFFRPSSCPGEGAPPEVFLLSPPPGALLAQHQQTLSGSLSEPASLTVNGEPAAVAPDLGFSFGPIVLSEGANRFELFARDAENDTGTLETTLTLDSMAPTIDFIAPAAGSTVFTARPALRLQVADEGSGADGSTLSLSRDGQPLAADCVVRPSTAVCTPTGDLPEGSSTLGASIADLAGNPAASPSLPLIVDTSAGAVITTVIGSVLKPDGTPAAGARVSVLGAGGVTGTVAGDGTFSLAGVGATSSDPLTVVVELFDGTQLLTGIATGVAPVPGGVSDAGLIELEPGCPPAFASGLFPGLGVAGGTISRVLAMTVWDDGSGPALYVGGDFETAGGLPVANVARWNGEAWSALAGGTGGPVRALAVYDDGLGASLYAGGDFTTAGGAAASRIARWDGASWSGVGAGVDGPVFALAVFGTGGVPQLYAGGAFDNAGGSPASRIARWDGTSWSGLGGFADRWVYSLAVFDNGSGPALYAGGNFSSIGGVAARRVARWDGTSWAPLGFGVGSSSNDTYPINVSALAVYDGELIASGLFASAGPSTRVSSIARWDGTHWWALDGGLESGGVDLPTPQGVQALAVFDDGSGPELYAAGEIRSASDAPADHVAAWDGERWRGVGAGLDQGGWGGMALAVYGEGSAARLYVGGGFAVAGGVPAGGIARWDGTAWTGLGSGTAGSIDALAVWDDGTGPALYVGGEQLAAGGLPGHLARWDGSSWSGLAGGTDGPVRALAVHDDGAGSALYAGGDFATAGGLAASHLARWDGSGWSGLGGGVDGPVEALASWDDGTERALIAAGGFTSAGGVPASRIARWDGLSWSPLGAGLSNTGRALLVVGQGPGSALYAGGDFVSAGGVTVNHVARWDGSSWSSLGTGVTGNVLALAPWYGGGEALVVGGSFASAGGVSAKRVALWDGVSWAALGAGLSIPAGAEVTALGVWDDGTGPALYAGGFFDAAGGFPAGGLARWNGATWAPLGTGADARVRALGVFDDGGGSALFAGGEFTTASGVVSAHLAKWYRPIPECEPGQGDTLPPSLAFTAPAEGAVVATPRPVLSLAWSDAGSGVDPTTLVLASDGAPFAASCVDFAVGADCTPAVDLAEGARDLSAVVADVAGNPSLPAGLTITIDTVPPAIAFTTPADGAVLGTATPEIRIAYSDTGSGIDPASFDLGTSAGVPPIQCSLLADEAVCNPTTPLPEGPVALSATIADLAGTPGGPAVLGFTVDLGPPSLAFTAPADGATVATATPQIRLAYSDPGVGVDTSTLALTADGAPLAATCQVGPDSAACLPDAPLAEGAVTLGATLADLAGAPSTASIDITVDTGPGSDTEPPVVAFLDPVPGGYFDPATEPVRLVWGDLGAGLDRTSLELRAGGAPVSLICDLCADGATCSVVDTIAGPVVTFTATVEDLAGNSSPPAEVTFVTDPDLDIVSPVITLNSPEAGLTAEPEVVFRGSLSETATLTLDGAPVTVAADLSFDHGPVALAEGDNPFTLLATDPSDNVGRLDLTVTLDSQPPPALDLSRITVGAVAGGLAPVSGIAGAVPAVEPGLVVVVGNTATGAETVTTPAGDGSFATAIAAWGGEELALAARDAAGNTGPPRYLPVPGAPALPPDPATVAPPLDPTVATDLCDATAFLYTGSDPIQKGVATGAIDCRRAAVVRGRVEDRAGAPLAGVTVSVAGHPEWGSTLSRADGAFDLAVSGGGRLTLRFALPGHLPAQRGVATRWKQWAQLDPVVLVPLDPAATAVDLTDPVPIQVARGSAMADADGTRRTTLLIPQGTTAEVDPVDGATEALTGMTVRATEYTVGDSGPAAMPAELPPTSGYTYAVELSVDEAGPAGAASVEFSQPLPVYVENFLSLPTGTIVPSGFYDRARGAWVAATDGLVVDILSVTGGLADLDVDGSGQPADAFALGALGITDPERETLAGLYAVGQSLWRVPVTHFSVFDFNFPAKPTAGAKGPSQPKPKGGDSDKKERDCFSFGSIIECTNQILGESLGIVGTPWTLNYRSDRVPGRKIGYTLDIPLSGSNLPPGLKRIELEVEIAGRRFTETFDAAPDQSHTFQWDGLDAYGRQVQGREQVRTSIGYVYDAQYQAPEDCDRCFGDTGGPGPAIGPTRGEITLRQEHRGRIGSWDALSQLELGGWSLSPHHSFDPKDHTLYLGSGGRRRLGEVEVVQTIAGNQSGDGADGQPAEETDLFLPSVVESAPSAPTAWAPTGGGYYIIDEGNCKIRYVSLAGIVTTVAGAGCGQGFLADGVAAQYARIDRPQGMTVGLSGEIYIADWEAPENDHHRIWRVDPRDGTISTVLQSQQGLLWPRGLTIDQFGDLYFCNEVSHTHIFRVESDGTLTTVAGGGGDLFANDIPSKQAAFAGCRDLEFNPVDFSLYIVEAPFQRVRRVTLDGFVELVAGNLTPGFSGDGGDATQAQLHDPGGIAFLPDGTLLIADTQNHRVRSVDWIGTIKTYAGSGAVGLEGGGFGGEGNLPRAAVFDSPTDVAVLPDATVLVADYFNHRIRGTLPAGTAGVVVLGQETRIPSEDGAVVYVFDEAGRHRRTEDADTGQALLTLGYGAFDDRALLTSITDVFGNVTTVGRDENGSPTAIIGPFGQQTDLTLHPSGYLESVTNLALEQVQLTYTADGLLRTLTDPEGETSTFTYDPQGLGRLIRDEDPVGGFTELSRDDTATGFTVTKTSALGRATTYTSEVLPAGTMHQTTVAPNGITTEAWLQPDGSRTVSYADGSTAALRELPDPRLGILAPDLSEATFTTAQGLAYSLATQELVTAYDPATGEPSVVTTTLTANGATTLAVHDLIARTVTTASPEGRVGSAQFDLFGRLTTTQAGGFEPVSYGYDPRGRLETVTQGTRVLTYVYYPDGYLEKVIDPLDREVRFTYDPVGRVETQTLPDGRVIGYDYDLNGNLTSITPPGRPAHGFDHTAIDLPETYTAPEAGSEPRTTTLAWNPDRQLELVTRPDGQTVDYVYDPGTGRLQSILAPHGTYGFTYDPTTGNPTSVTDPDGGSLTYGYDGALPLSATWAGEVSGSVEQVYDADFRIDLRTVNGTDPVDFDYDLDGFLTQAGALTLVHDPVSGLLTDTALGAVTDVLVPNEFGELRTYTARYGGADVYSFELVRDDSGRITDKVELVEGATDTYHYVYDPAGRLTDVERDGALWAHYDYDSNSNRTGWTDPWGSGSVTLYDDQDRLLTYGDKTYTYTANGELQTKSQNGQTVSYDTDVFGNLRGVTLEDGLQIAYVIDAANRRVGKKVAGTLVQGFLYGDQLEPVAELDGGGAMVSRFVYASAGHVPDYMVKGGETYRLVSDHLGSVRLVINAASGTVAQRLDYDPFGRVLLDTNPGFQPFGYAGGLYDTHTGLVRFGARDYDPETGRWTTKDPIGFAGGGTNLYGYVLADPINGIDPSGLDGEVLDDIQLALDIVGFVPVIGDAVDLINGGISLLRGDCLNAALSFAAAIPVIGGAATAGKWARKGLKYADEAVEVAKHADDFVEAANVPRGTTRLLPEVSRTGQLTQGGLDHIVLRHWATSGAQNAGKFAQGTTARQLRSMIGDTLESGTIRANTAGRPGHIFEYDFGHQIGVDLAGNPATRLRVVRSPDGTIKTAFPF